MFSFWIHPTLHVKPLLSTRTWYSFKMFSKSIVLFIVACAIVNAFSPASRLTSRIALRMSETPAEGQTVKDLNLEEMFEVFEAADGAIADEASPTKPSPKSASGSFGTEGAKAGVGASGPLGFFDPSGFTTDIEESQYKLYQEAETKHGRVAMLAFLGIVAGELVNPATPAIYQFQEAGPTFANWALVFCAWIEGGYIIRGWQGLDETLKEPLGVAKLKKDQIPGDYGFDILKKKPKTVDAYNVMKTKELNNGRLAMLGVAGIVAQELITNQSIF